MDTNTNTVERPARKRITKVTMADEAALDMIEREMKDGSSQAAAIRRRIERSEVTGASPEAMFQRLERKVQARRKSAQEVV
jgi:hypothetical protein